MHSLTRPPHAHKHAVHVRCHKRTSQEENKRVARENEKLAGQIHDVQHNLNEMTRRRAEAEAAEAPEAVAGVGLLLAYPVDGAGNDIYGVGFVVIQVTPGGSAYNNGRVMVGDRLVSIDGENVTNLRMQALVSRIGGPGGSKVVSSDVLAASGLHQPSIVSSLHTHTHHSLTHT